MINPNVFPAGGNVVPLEAAVEFLDHLRKPVTERDRVTGPYPYYGANGQQDSVSDFIFDEPLILLAEDGGNFGQAGRTVAYRIEGKSWVNNHAHVLRPREGVDLAYLCRQLEYYDLSPWTSGTTRAKLTKSKAQTIPVLLPPLAEQRRVAAILDKADAVRRKAQQALDLTDDLIRSTFLDMFGDPVRSGSVPQTVEWVASDSPGSIRTGPFGSQLLHTEFVDSGIHVLGIDNFVENRFKWGKGRFITEEKYGVLKRYKVLPRDVVITIMGTLGRCGIVPDDIPEAINTKHLCCITLNFKKCLPEFLHAAFLYHPDILRQLGVKTKGAIMPGLNMGIIKKLQLPLPPIELQEAFADFVRTMGRGSERLTDQRDDAGDLFNSCLQRAFTGGL